MTVSITAKLAGQSASGSFDTTVQGIPSLLAQSFAAVAVPADTTEDTLATITVPANALGANGRLRILTFWSFTNNANTKTVRLRLGSAAGTVIGAAQAFSTQINALVLGEVWNLSATNSQQTLIQSHTTASAGAIGVSTAAIDTTAATSVVITGQKAVSTDTFTLVGYSIELTKP